MAKIVITNKTHWSTADLRRFVVRCAKQEQRKRVDITFTYTRRDEGWTSGYAWYNSTRSVVRLPRSYVDQRDMAHTIAHELAHNANVRHADMKDDPYYRRVGRWRTLYEWAADLPLTKVLPKPKTRPSVEFKLAHAIAKASEWQTKIKRAQTGFRQWQAKARRYERQLAAAKK